MTAVATPSMSYTSSMPNPTKKTLLVSQLVEQGKTLDLLGFVVFWNIRDVDITRDQFLSALAAAGLPDKYAREHNARNSLLRALNAFKERKIVRMTHEDQTYATFQFTAEEKVGSGGDSRLDYAPEVLVTVDKEYYTMLRDEKPTAFRESIVKVVHPQTGEQVPNAEDIKDQLDKVFTYEMNSYKSSDITRYIQKIFEDNADIVSLRQQGSIYFIPGAYAPVVESVRKLVSQIGGAASRFDAIPMPDVRDTRKTVGDSFAEEVATILADLDSEVTKMNSSSKDITEKWVQYRKGVIAKVKERIDMYAELLGEKAAELNGGFDRISAMLKPRVLDLT